MEKIFKRAIVLTAGLLSLCLLLAAGTSEEIEPVLQGIDKKQKAMKSFSAKFKQIKNFEIMNDVITSSGKMYFKKPDKMLWKYEVPDRFNILIKKRTVYIYSPESKKVKKYHLPKKGKTFPLFGCFSQPVEQLKKDYKINLMVNVSTANQCGIELKPIKKKLKKYFHKVEILFDKESYLLNSIKIFEQGGDLTEITFFDIEFNKEIKDEIFNRAISNKP